MVLVNSIHSKKDSLNYWDALNRERRFFSMIDLLSFNRELRDPGSKLSRGRYVNTKSKRDMLALADLDLTNLDIRKLEQGVVLDRKLYNESHLELMNSLVSTIKNKGWDISGYRTSYDGTKLQAVVEAAGNTCLVTILSPQYHQIGSINIGSRSIYPHNKGGATKVFSKKEEDEDKNKSNGNRAKVNDEKTETIAQKAAKLGIDPEAYQPLKAKGLLSRQIQSATAILESYLSPDYSVPIDLWQSGRGFLSINYNGIEYSVTNDYNTSTGLDLVDVLAPKTFRELVDQAYAKALENGHEESSLLTTDQMLKENGDLDLSLVDMRVVNRYMDRQQVLDLTSLEFRNRVAKGESLDDVRLEFMTDRSGLVTENGVVEVDLEHNVSSELEDDAMDNFEDGEYEDKILTDDGEDLDVAVSEAGSRSAVAMRLVGLTDELGNPLAGWLSDEKFESNPMYEQVIEQARLAALQTGVTLTNARFDNDGVLHWQGQQNVRVTGSAGALFNRELSGKLGQFFFPTHEPYYDEKLQKTVKKGVMHLKFGSGKEEYAVPYWQLHFVEPQNRTMYKDDKIADDDPRKINHHHGDLSSRMVFRGFNQALNQQVATAMKNQILVHNGEGSVYDASSLNKVYRQASKIDEHALERPGVVEQARAAVVIPSSYLTTEHLLREEEAVEVNGRVVDEQSPGQYIRSVLNGTEGILCPIATTEGTKYGLRRNLTSAALDLFDEELRKNPTGKFAMSGALDNTYYRGGLQETWMHEGLMGAPESYKQRIRELYASLPGIHEIELPADDAPAKEWLKLARSPLVEESYREFGIHDSSDRQNMTLKALQVGLDVIGGHFDDKGRDKVSVAYTTLGGTTFDDGLVMSREFVERYEEETGYKIRIGDKFTDLHGNKGVVSYISGMNPNSHLYHPDIENFFKAANGTVDLVQSPYSLPSRGNAGTKQEAIAGYTGKVLYPEGDPRGFDKDGKQLSKDDPGRVWAQVSKVSIVRTPYTAMKKTVPYELKNSFKRRKLSMQHKAILEARDCTALMRVFYKDNSKKELEFMHYMNAIGVSFAGEDGLIRPTHIDFAGKTQKDMYTIVDKGDGNVQKNLYKAYVEDLAPDAFVVDVDDVYMRNDMLETYNLPEGGAYLRLPIMYEKAGGSDLPLSERMYSQHLYILPEKFRDQEELIDGTMNSHTYTRAIEKIVRTSEENERLKMEYIERHFEIFQTPPPGMKHLESFEQVQRLYESKDKDFMEIMAKNQFEGIQVNPDKIQSEETRRRLFELKPDIEAFNAEFVNAIKESNEKVRSAVTSYQTSVARDKVGLDARGTKHSFLRRHMIGRNIDNSVSSILTESTALSPDTLAIGPLTAYGLGIIQPKEEIREQVEALCKVEDFQSVQDLLAKDGWEYAKGVDPDSRIAAWRDPVLHTPSISGFKFVVENEITGVAINPLLTKGFAADFDGDTLGLAFTKDKEAQKELETKISIESNLLNFRSDYMLNLGMDNAWYFAQSDEGEVERENLKRLDEARGEEPKKRTMKEIVASKMSRLRDSTLGMEYAFREFNERRYKERFGRDFDRARYDELRQSNSVKTDEDRLLVKHGMQIDDSARTRSRAWMMHELKDFSKKYVANYEGNQRDFYVDTQSKEQVFESVKEMIQEGLKGNMGGYNRAEKFFDKGVEFDDAQYQSYAQAGKVDFTGIAGAGFLRTYLLSVDSESMVDIPVMYRSFERVDGQIVPTGEWKEGVLRTHVSDVEIVAAAMESPTQAVLQLKHDPRDVEPTKEFLNNARKFVVGPSNQDDRALVTVNFERFDDKIGSFSSLVSERDSRERQLAARYLDAMVQDAKNRGSNAIEVDINFGNVYIDKKDDPLNNKQLSQKVKEEVYGLMFESTWKQRGLDVSQDDWRTIQKHVRDDKGNMMNYETNKLLNGKLIDQIAQGGYDGVVEAANHNYKNFMAFDGKQPQKGVNALALNDGHYNAYVIGKAGKVVEMFKEEMKEFMDKFKEETRQREQALQEERQRLQDEMLKQMTDMSIAFDSNELDDMFEVARDNQLEAVYANDKTLKREVDISVSDVLNGSMGTPEKDFEEKYHQYDASNIEKKDLRGSEVDAIDRDIAQLHLNAKNVQHYEDVVVSREMKFEQPVMEPVDVTSYKQTPNVAKQVDVTLTGLDAQSVSDVLNRSTVTTEPAQQVVHMDTKVKTDVQAVDVKVTDQQNVQTVQKVTQVKETVEVTPKVEEVKAEEPTPEAAPAPKKRGRPRKNKSVEMDF